MIVLFRALTYATLFIGLLLVFVPDQILAPQIRHGLRCLHRHTPPLDASMALLIRGGRIITATEDFTGDIYAENETITRIEPQIDPRLVAPGADVIEARGKYVFPGFIDPHVHI